MSDRLLSGRYRTLKQNGKLEMVWFCVCGFEGIV